jgi:class III poly(R)-hydroxyalkanoic acid synthase PhaE subunit
MWMEMNKNMYDTWGNWASQMTQAAMPTGDKVDANPMTAFFDMVTKGFNQNPMFNMFANAGNTANAGSMMDQIFKQWQDSMKNMSMYIPNQAIRDGFDRFMSSHQMYANLQQYWDAFLKNMPTDITDWNAYTKPIMDYYKNITGSMMQPFMPEQLNNVFSVSFDSISAMQKQFMDYLKPIMDDSAELQALWIKALQGDKDAYLEFLKACSDAYKNSYSKLLNMPQVGASKETVEKLMKLQDYYVTFVISLNEYTVLINNLMSETMESLLKHLSDLQVEGKQPQTFMEFYKLWSSFNEKAFQELFATDTFTKIMNETVSAGSKLKILYDDYMQDVLSFLPLPNRRELDSVEEEVYELRKRVKALEKELKINSKTTAADKDADTPPAKGTAAKK